VRWIVLGTILALWSGLPIYDEIREAMALSELKHRYLIASPSYDKSPPAEGMQAAAMSFGQCVVELGDGPVASTSRPDAAPATQEESSRVLGSVRVTVNGRDYSTSSAVSIAPNRKGGHGRYSGWLTAAVIEDRYEGWRRLLILQRVDPYLNEQVYWKTRLTAFRFRLLTIAEDCAVTSEESLFRSDGAHCIEHT
jgi:hypothetical protein